MSNERTAGIILAAGESSRFGSPKQLADFRGKPLLERVIDVADASELDTIILVLGYAHTEILERFNDRLLESEIFTFINHRYKTGQSSSLQLGLSMVRGDHQAAMFLLCDQPLINTHLINQLIIAFRKSPKTICVPVSGGRRCSPAIFGNNHFEALMKIRGDRGGRDIIRQNTQHVHEIRIPNPQVLIDIDTPDDLAKLNSLKS